MKIEQVTEETKESLSLSNEPFQLFGELLVTRSNGSWEYSERTFDQRTEKTFPEENYSFENISQKGFAVAAYDQGQCVGLAVFEIGWNKYCYLSDLKVKENNRGRGISKQMLDFAMNLAKEKHCKGLSTIAQAYNLAANRFYLKYGFEIGGLNTRDYEFTSERGNSDIYYYLNF
ncbi:GNAT family N-acetyltransferase [Alkalihalobacillus sp. NPDC078783]